MKTKAFSLLAVLLLGGCSTQPVRFSGHVPEAVGTPAQEVWSRELARRDSERWFKNHASVRAVRGNAKVEAADGEKEARVGAALPAGSRLRTGANTITDLFLGENGPVLRLTENSSVRLVRLDLWKRGEEKIVNTMIDVEEGRVLGNVKKLAAESSYLLRTRAGVIRIRGTEFEVSADGRCSIIKGAAQVFAGGQSILVSAGERYEPGRGVVKLDPAWRPDDVRIALAQ